MEEKRGDVSQKIVLKNSIQKKIDFLLKKPEISPVEAYNVVKKFFQGFFGNEYEYTREELIENLKKFYIEGEEKQKLIEIIRYLGRIEFSDPEYSQRELSDKLQEFSNIIDTIVESEAKQLGFWDRIVKKLKSKISKEEEVEDGEKTVQEEVIDEIKEENQEEKQKEKQYEKDSEKEKEEIQRQSSYYTRENFNKLLQDFYQALENNVEEAASLYEEIEEIYEALSKEDQQELYDSLVEMYNTLKKREPEESSKGESYSEEKEWERDYYTTRNFNYILQEFYNELGRDLEEARDLYEQLNYIYEALDEDTQQRLYTDLNQAYEELSDKYY